MSDTSSPPPDSESLEAIEKAEQVATETKNSEKGSRKRRRRQGKELSPNYLFDDGYKWCKYGEKPTMGSAFVRSYYKCNNKETNCRVRKTIDMHSGSNSRVRVSYSGMHNHPLPSGKEVFIYQAPELSNPVSDLIGNRLESPSISVPEATRNSNHFFFPSENQNPVTQSTLEDRVTSNPFHGHRSSAVNSAPAALVSNQDYGNLSSTPLKGQPWFSLNAGFGTCDSSCIIPSGAHSNPSTNNFSSSHLPSHMFNNSVDPTLHMHDLPHSYPNQPFFRFQYSSSSSHPMRHPGEEAFPLPQLPGAPSDSAPALSSEHCLDPGPNERIGGISRLLGEELRLLAAVGTCDQQPSSKKGGDLEVVYYPDCFGDMGKDGSWISPPLPPDTFWDFDPQILGVPDL